MEEIFVEKIYYKTKAFYITLDLIGLNLFKASDWKVNYHGYLYCKTRIFHRELIKCLKGLVVDHINSVKTDNRLINLRICTNSENVKFRADKVVLNTKRSLKSIRDMNKLNKRYDKHRAMKYIILL